MVQNVLYVSRVNFEVDLPFKKVLLVRDFLTMFPMPFVLCCFAILQICAGLAGTSISGFVGGA